MAAGVIKPSGRREGRSAGDMSDRQPDDYYSTIDDDRDHTSMEVH